eukprot:PDM77977.1 hypothetical protein PRIPAC_35166 [Pristionchus pacificus]
MYTSKSEYVCPMLILLQQLGELLSNERSLIKKCKWLTSSFHSIVTIIFDCFIVSNDICVTEQLIFTEKVARLVLLGKLKIKEAHHYTVA